MFFLAE
jgi:hypothetical protein